MPRQTVKEELMISIIIPVYNEEAALDRTLSSLPYNEDIEVVVVDSQSNDRTVEIAQKYPVKVVTSSRGRAAQMNAGASAAKGDTLLFLHADCALEAKSLRSIKKYLTLNYVGGCFTQKIDSPKNIYRWIETSGNLRAELTKIFYGDQAIFVRRDNFHQIGGFAQVSLFEDVIFTKKLRRTGKTIVLDDQAAVLPRRWEKEGIIKTTLLYWVLTAGFILGVSTDQLAKLYKNVR